MKWGFPLSFYNARVTFEATTRQSRWVPDVINDPKKNTDATRLTERNDVNVHGNGASSAFPNRVKGSGRLTAKKVIRHTKGDNELFITYKITAAQTKYSDDLTR